VFNVTGVDALAELMQEQSERDRRKAPASPVSPNAVTVNDQRMLISDLMQLLREQCSVVGHILSDVLSLQKIEEGKFDLEMAPFSPELLVQNTVESFRPSLQRKHLQINVIMQSLDKHVSSHDCVDDTSSLPRARVHHFGEDIDATVQLTKPTVSSLQDTLRAISVDTSDTGYPAWQQSTIDRSTRIELEATPSQVCATAESADVRAQRELKAQEEVELDPLAPALDVSTAPVISISPSHMASRFIATRSRGWPARESSPTLMGATVVRAVSKRLLIGGRDHSGVLLMHTSLILL